MIEVIPEEVAGQGSPLHKKYGVWLHRVAVTSLPEEYQARLTEMVAGEFSHLKLLVPEPYDCILSKLERGWRLERMATGVTDRCLFGAAVLAQAVSSHESSRSRSGIVRLKWGQLRTTNLWRE